MLSQTYQFFETIPLAGALFRKFKYPLKRAFHYYLNPEARKSWGWRIQDVLSAPDNRFIPRVAEAGQMVEGYLIMHNGIRIFPNSYCGEPMRLMLEKNRGVHEPQEERLFMEVLKHMPEGPLMLELGANWGFYSMWFHLQTRNPSCFLVEPLPGCLEFGQQNFALNKMQGKFIHGLIGASSGRTGEGIPILCVDDLVAEHGIKHVHILHADIQGAEADMLAGAQKTISARKVDYIFISSHSSELHEMCRSWLLRQGFVLIADADLKETYSYDGLLVARRSELKGLEPVPISKKRGGQQASPLLG
jgi:hypothetical protein